MPANIWKVESSYISSNSLNKANPPAKVRSKPFLDAEHQRVSGIKSEWKMSRKLEKNQLNACIRNSFVSPTLTDLCSHPAIQESAPLPPRRRLKDKSRYRFCGPNLMQYVSVCVLGRGDSPF